MKHINCEKKNRSYAYLITCLFSFAIVILFSGQVCAQGGDALFIDEKGNVGIGTDKPETTLDVNGDLKVRIQEEWKEASLNNNWKNASIVFNEAGYYKDSMGTIHLRGVVKNIGNSSLSKVIFTLEEGYQPLCTEVHLAGISVQRDKPLSWSSGPLKIDQTGEVWAPKEAIIVSLDGITFRAPSPEEVTRQITRQEEVTRQKRREKFERLVEECKKNIVDIRAVISVNEKQRFFKYISRNESLMNKISGNIKKRIKEGTSEPEITPEAKAALEKALKQSEEILKTLLTTPLTRDARRVVIPAGPLYEDLTYRVDRLLLDTIKSLESAANIIETSIPDNS